MASSVRCSVCYEVGEHESGSGWLAVQPCGHVFHHACLLQSLEYKNVCPNCRNPGAGKAKNRLRIYLDLASGGPCTPGAAAGTPRIHPEHLAAKERELGDAIKELQSVRESLAAETAKRKEAALGQANALKRKREVEQQMDTELTGTRKRLSTLKDQMDRKDKYQKSVRDQLVWEKACLQKEADSLRSRFDPNLTAPELLAIAKRMRESTEARGGGGNEQSRHWAEIAASLKGEQQRLTGQVQASQSREASLTQQLSAAHHSRQTLQAHITKLQQQLEAAAQTHSEHAARHRAPAPLVQPPRPPAARCTEANTLPPAALTKPPGEVLTAKGPGYAPRGRADVNRPHLAPLNGRSHHLSGPSGSGKGLSNPTCMAGVDQDQRGLLHALPAAPPPLSSNASSFQGSSSNAGSFRGGSITGAGTFIRQGADGRGGRTKSLLLAATRQMPPPAQRQLQARAMASLAGNGPAKPRRPEASTSLTLKHFFASRD
ncbi:hypothetical protein WJX84_005163 [Apatococcus fuscideae]|uniref:RING-type domain-containing protein n=1 Tax=Apatococcus fuscideae TaxID=2026836 RepID=A0AAW1TGB2_9CHLO